MALFLAPVFVKPALWVVGLVAGSAVVNNWWGRTKDEAGKAAVGVLGVFVVMVGVFLAARFWRLIK